MRQRPGILLSLCLLLAACGSADAGDRIEHPTDATPVLQVEVRGGFVGPNVVFSQVPSFTMLGDGRVIQAGAVDAIFPGPVLPPLLERRLTVDGMQLVLREVAATRLFAASRELRNAAVADASDTVFTLHAGGREVVVTVFALGIDAGMPADEARAHRLLMNLEMRLESLDQWLPASAWADAGWHPHRADAYRLLVLDADAGEQDPSGIGFNVVAWPGAQDPTAGAPAFGGGRCQIAAGAEADAWTTALGSANQLTRWTSAGRRYVVQPRQLLPGEQPECPRI